MEDLLYKCDMIRQKKDCFSSPRASLFKGRMEAFFSAESDSTLSPEYFPSNRTKIGPLTRKLGPNSIPT